MLVDLTSKNITGKQAETGLGKAGITVNKNMIPFDQRSPFVTSGIRIGTPAVTTRGMKEPEMNQIAEFMRNALADCDNESKLKEIKAEVKNFCSRFPLYTI
jgi:glycine hydroxymethyltransferase